MPDTTAPTDTVASDGQVPVILTGQALRSLRDSGHSLSTAVAEVVDNALEAKANQIRLRLDRDNGGAKSAINRIIVADDGHGMNAKILQQYLQIGFSTRYMRTDTIGKYGVGAKLAALSFATRIDVWSRTSDSDPWRHVFFDLNAALIEEGKTGRFPGIAPPEARPIPTDLQALAPAGPGTLVVWNNVDRLTHGRAAETSDALINELQRDLSRIFREFLDGGRAIEVNGVNLLPHDPLFFMSGTLADHVLTRMLPAEEREKLAPGEIRHFGAFRITDEPIKIGPGEARLRVTLYPPQVTRKRFMGGDKLAVQLRVPENQGAISFVRMKREISYTTVPKILPDGVQTIDRFIGIEVSFDARLDEFFGVRNVKRGVEPHGQLRLRIRDALKRHIPTARQMLEERWGAISRDDEESGGEHTTMLEALKVVDLTMPASKTPAPAKPVVERELSELAEDVGFNTEDSKKEYLERIRGLPFVLVEVDFPGKQFIDVRHLDNQIVIRLNTRHKFYRELWQPLADMAKTDPGAVSGDDAVKTASRAVEALMLMVVAYGKAQSMAVDPNDYADLTMDWGKFLDTLLGKVKNVS